MGNCQKSFGITIRLLRLSRKLKQEQLAEKSGLSLRHIKSIEGRTGAHPGIGQLF
ncbi:helix-turn-helix domain-containing protein, partial [Bilophila wadsworthia]|uniref:helix-turn-helix domain-containing protein n=1 Tax=Bilophila wadsworthia TaxID=35833 RepID=UPI003AB50822